MSVSRIVTSRSPESIFFQAPLSRPNQYSVLNNLKKGVYVMSCSSTIEAEATFINSNNEQIITVRTVSGIVQFNLLQEASKIIYNISTGTNIRISLQRTGTEFNGSIGTLTTITTTQTYTPPAPGFARVCVLGGGGGGQPGFVGPINMAWAGGGGGSGYATFGTITLNSSVGIPAVVGAGGLGTDGGTTNFGPLSAAGGKFASGTVGGAGGSGGGAGATPTTGFTPGAVDGQSSSGAGSGVVGVSSFVSTSAGINSAAGGGIYGGGAGGGNAANRIGGGGGGGAVPGSSGQPGGSPGGSGGPGGVFILRWT